MRVAGVALMLVGCLGLFIANIPISPRQAIQNATRPTAMRRPAATVIPPLASALAILAGTALWFLAARGARGVRS